MHALSEIGHDTAELAQLLRDFETLAPGKRIMLMFGGDLNMPLRDPLPNENDHYRDTTTDTDARRTFTTGSCT